MGSKRKEIEKRMLVKKTINSMNKQIQVLEEQKKVFIEKAKRAKQLGLEDQVKLALVGYKMTVVQQRRAQEMLLNIEICSQMKDMTAMTSEFLAGMSVLSKQMSKLSKEKEFLKVQKEFEVAMEGVQTQSEQIELFMDSSKDSFAAASGVNDSMDFSETEVLVENQTAIEVAGGDAEIEKELERIKKEIESC